MKLTLQQAAQIRKESKKFGGTKTMRVLQEEYKVSYETIQAVLQGFGAYKIFSLDPDRAEQLSKITDCIYDRSQPKEQVSQDTTRTKNITMEHFYGKPLMTDSADIDIYLQTLMRNYFHVTIGAPETVGISTNVLVELLYMFIEMDLLKWRELDKSDRTVEEANEPIVLKLDNSVKRRIGDDIANFFENVETVSRTDEKEVAIRAKDLFSLLIKRWVKNLPYEQTNIPMLRQVYTYKGQERRIAKGRGRCAFSGIKTAIYPKIFPNENLIELLLQELRNNQEYTHVYRHCTRYNPEY